MRSDHGLRIGGVADDDRDVELVEFGGEVMILNDGDDGRACLVKLGGERRQQAALARDDDLVVKLFGGRSKGASRSAAARAQAQREVSSLPMAGMKLKTTGLSAIDRMAAPTIRLTV